MPTAVPFRSFHASHLARASNCTAHGWEPVTSPAVACLYNEYNWRRTYIRVKEKIFDVRICMFDGVIPSPILMPPSPAMLYDLIVFSLPHLMVYSLIWWLGQQLVQMLTIQYNRHCKGSNEIRETISCISSVKRRTVWDILLRTDMLNYMCMNMCILSRLCVLYVSIWIVCDISSRGSSGSSGGLRVGQRAGSGLGCVAPRAGKQKGSSAAGRRTAANNVWNPQNRRREHHASTQCTHAHHLHTHGTYGRKLNRNTQQLVKCPSSMPLVFFYSSSPSHYRISHAMCRK